MNTITADTLLTFTEIKNGHATGRSYNNTAGSFIQAIKNKDCDGELNVGVEPTEFDEDGEPVEFGADKFYELPIIDQLDMCCRREGDANASVIHYEIAA